MEPGMRGAGLDDLIERIYAAAADPVRWHDVLDGLRRACGGGMGMFNMHDVAVHNGSLMAAARMDPAWHAAYDNYYAARNPWLRNLPKRPVGVAVPAEFMLDRSELTKTEFYNDFLRPQGLLSGVGVTLLQDHKRFVVLSVLYSGKLAERARANVTLVQRLTPHLVRASQITRQLAAAEFRWQVAEASLEGLAAGVVILDAAGRMVFANSSANRIVREHDGLSFDRDGRLRAAGAADDVRLKDLVTRAVSYIGGKPGSAQGASGVLSVARPSGQRAYSLLVSPLHPPASIFQGIDRAVAIFISDPAQPLSFAADTLMTLFGLTAAEARLAARLAAGDALDAIADDLGIAKETARNQVKAIFAKTGTHRQAELVAILARLAHAPETGRPA
jgi:DNA-binding CsgD family transcriptional regulator